MEKDQGSTSPSQNPLQPVVEVLQGADPQLVSLKYGIQREDLDQRIREFQESRRRMALQESLNVEKVGRNAPCPCGSGKKYKKCCLSKHQEVRKTVSSDQLQEMEEIAKNRKRLEKEIGKSFDFIFSQDFGKARRAAQRMLESYPEDDRLHDILVTTHMANREYDDAFHLCRRRWQVALEEKEFFQENGYHKRSGQDQKQLVFFYAPSTWLEKFWIAQRARTYRDQFPVEAGSPLAAMVNKLKIANDARKFPERQEKGYEARRQVLAPVLEQLEAQGAEAIPYLLPLTYSFSWASLFVPDLLYTYGTETSTQLLAELSMFRLPYFAQKCLTYLEELGEGAIPHIQKILEENNAFDELKVGLIQVLGNIPTPEAFNILVGLVDHDNLYVIKSVAQALEHHDNPDASQYLKKVQERLEAQSEIAGIAKELARQKKL